MTPDPLAATQDAIRELVNRKRDPQDWLTATFTVVEGLSSRVAQDVLARLLQQRYLAVYDADLAQMLAQRPGLFVARVLQIGRFAY